MLVFTFDTLGDLFKAALMFGCLDEIGGVNVDRDEGAQTQSTAPDHCNVVADLQGSGSVA